MEDHEASELIPRGVVTTTSGSLAELKRELSTSIGDWIAVVLLLIVGFKLDGLQAFEIDLGPQLAHDYTITYPHTPAALQQVPAPLLWKVVFVMPLVLLPPLIFVTTRHPKVSAIRLLSQLLLGVFSSVGVALCLVCLTKNYIGRLRPDFVARCQPVAGKCTGDRAVVMEGRKSFPSGHSALSFASMGYVSLAWLSALLGAPTPPAFGSLLKLMLSALPWAVALLIALSRYDDYWHHWQDILVGTLLGHACCFVAFRLRFPSPTLGRGLVPHAQDGAPLRVADSSMSKQHTSPASEPV